MKKRVFMVLGLAALMAFTLVITACGDVEHSATFENYSEYDISVECPGSTPESFTLKGLVNVEIDDPTKQVVTRTNKNIECKWREGKSGDWKSPPQKDEVVKAINVKATNTSGGIKFENIEGSKFSIKKF